MPKVQLIDHTYDAATKLIFAKSTRLGLKPELMDDIARYSFERRMEELEYISITIRSSWEFVDMTFLISGVTRACAQQITRTRTGSYAMQSQRVTDMSDVKITKPNLGAGGLKLWNEAEQEMKAAYSTLISIGVSKEDARGILPMNTQTNLLAKYNLRAFADLVSSRRSLRTQSEYREIVKGMVGCVEAVWPWVSTFLQPVNDAAIQMLEEIAEEFPITPGEGVGWRIAKAIDLLRSNK